MGRNKTRKKNHRSGQNSEDQDPDVSETEPSSSDNISSSLNDTVVLSSNVMDTDVEDSEQTTGDSTPAEESDQGVVGDGKLSESMLIKNNDMSVSNSTSEDAPETSRLSQWLDDQQTQDSPEPEPTQPPSVTCSHVKGSTSMPGLRKAMKSDVTAVCSAKPCVQAAEEVGAGDGSSPEVSSKQLWICLQCGHFGCGDHKAQGGDALTHFKTPRSDQHSLVVKLGAEMDKVWCFNCQTFVDTKHASLKEGTQFLKRHAKLRSLQSNNKTGTTTTPVIALGPPPPPPQPETSVENNQFKSSMMSKNKMNSRNKSASYWDNGPRDDWPLGLENLGNTCFMNSALQCLSRTKSLSPKLDLYGTGNTIEIRVTADPPSVEVLGLATPETNGNGETSTALFQLDVPSDGAMGDENGDSNHAVPATETETGGSSPSSSEMDSLLDVASGASSKSSPSKELTPENYKEEIEKELKKCLRLKLVIPKDSMTSRLRHAFKAMTRSADVQGTGAYSSSEYFGSRGRHVFTPSAIHSAMNKHFRPGQQHDSHELLRTVVDMMKKDQVKAFRLAIMQCYGIKKSEGKNCDPKIAELLKMWDRKLYHKTFVDEIFGGELVTFQTCLICGSVRKSHEDFLDLSLPIRVYTKNHHIPKRTYSIFDDDGDSNRSLEDCLKSFTEPEQLTGSNAVECENCHRTNLEKLNAGASFEEVFPGVKPPVTVTESKSIKPVVEPALETEMDAVEPEPYLLMEEETPQVYSNATEDMDDLDEPAVDGIIGNTSDMEDEGNDVPPVFLLGESDDKSVPTTDFLSSSDIPNKDNMSLSLAATQDEGFSESDSSEEKKSASISASSSRNSISEADNVASSSQQKNKETTKPIPITKGPCSRRQMVWRPPECLTIHLKRFQITSHGTSKLSDRVNFPYILNLTPFCAPKEDEVEDRDVFDEDGEVKYALYGIVEHSGSLHWGHYVAYTKVHGTNPGSEETSSGSSGSSSSTNKAEPTPDKWFYISDSSVSPSSLESVQGMDPYILFYERIRGQEKKEKLEQLQRLTNPSCSSTTDATAVAATTSNTTSQVAGCSFDFNLYNNSSVNNALD